MERSLPPSVDFYYDDFMAGTADMHPLAAGMYIKTICFQFGKGSVPNDKAKLMRITGASSDEFDEHWPDVLDKLEETEDGKLVNIRAQAEMDKKVASRNSRITNGRKGGRPKAKVNRLVPSRLTETEPKPKAKKTETEEGSRKKEEGREEEKNGVDLVVEHYQKHHPRSRPGDKERKKIRALLKDGYSPVDLCEAIDGCHRTPYNLGANDSGQKYLELELICRDSSHVDRFVRNNKSPPRPKNGQALPTKSKPSREKMLANHEIQLRKEYRKKLRDGELDLEQIDALVADQLKKFGGQLAESTGGKR